MSLPIADEQDELINLQMHGGALHFIYIGSGFVFMSSQGNVYYLFFFFSTLSLEAYVLFYMSKDSVAKNRAHFAPARPITYTSEWLRLVDQPQRNTR